MGYLGNDLQVAYSTYKNIDDISGSFNGSTTSFSLLVGGVAPVPLPLNSQQCLISVGGVIQRPDETGAEGFRLSGGNIIFSSAPSTGEDFFGVILAGADYVNVGANFPSGSASVPSITFDTDLDTGIYNPSSNNLAISTSGTQRLVVDGSGNVNIDTGTFYVDAANNRVGIGTTSPSTSLHVSNASNAEIRLGSGSYDAYIGQDSAGVLAISQAQAGSIKLQTNGTERARIDSSGRLLVGTSSAVNTAGSGLLQVVGGDAARPVIHRNINDQYPPGLYFSKARGTGNQAVQNGDSVGFISFLGYDGAAGYPAATIEALIDAAPGTTDMPGRLVFSTTADGASSPTERMRITNGGIIGFGLTPTGSLLDGDGAQIIPGGAVIMSRASAATLVVNRSTDDGTIISIRQAAVEEGTISVSGTTVSYNGAHLSRWSQLPSGAERTEILRGSVLSNIDEMCEWGEEGNEQLNRMKVSDVEGDKNVAGVFQCWDDDDDTYTNDFYCAMTGDFIIRIAADTTVERGDLLMSAGDGTAKPQGDGYVQDKTIAKVTSTNVTCTYEDGSYCVPCVLMAC